jgi:ATP-binding protein involved in chromosome partitioning
MPLTMYKSEPRHLIGIAAGKGGVGKSSVTVNLALALKEMGYSVGVLDADVYGPSIRAMLPEDTAPKQQGDQIIPAVCSGIQMISMAYFRKEGEAAAVRAPIANGMIQQFMKQVAWGALDYLLIDFPPGTGDIQLTLAQQGNLTGAVMVTTPQEVALLDVRKAMNLFDHVKVPIIGVVENMSYYLHEATGERLFLFGKGGGERLAAQSGVPLLGQVPIDPLICRTGDLGLSLFSQKEASSALAFRAIAKALAYEVEILTESSRGCLKSFELAWTERDCT